MPVSEVGAPDLSRSGQGRPLVSMEGWARFEQRARQRRIEHRLEAARAAIRSRQWAAARAALDELKELDPSLPELDALTLQITRSEKGARSHRGALVLAAAVFATVLLAAAWIEKAGPLPSYPDVEPAPLAPAPEAVLTSRDIAVDLRNRAFDLPVATTGSAVTGAVLSDAATIDPPPVPLPPPVSDLPAGPSATLVPSPASTPAPPSTQVPASLPAASPLTPSVPLPSQLELPSATAPEPVLTPPVASPARPPVQPASVATTAASPGAPAISAAAPAVPVVDDATQVRAVLQRYQAAYERLDAGLVHAVWPGVNEAALARAFEGLESQALTFNTCDVQLRGATANVVCQGTTRYVPKIGSRAPRVESLAWNFTLRKRANDWEIQSARAER